MKRLGRLSAGVAGMLAAVFSAAVVAQEAGTADEAKALMGKAVTALHADKAKALAAITAKDHAYIDRDLYVFCINLDGVIIGHGANQALVGKSMIDLKDADGKPFIRSQIDIIKTAGEGWVDYKWTNPVSKKIEPKSAYVLKVESDYYCGVGVYKK